MATNFEFYKDKILEIANKDDDFGVMNGEVRGCCASKCDKCLFYICDGLCSSVSKIQWLYAEHIEQPKLTKRERAFCDYVGYGYIARDEFDKKCYWFADKPIKSGGEWCSDGAFMWVLNNVTPFDFVKWEDEKPWSVEDLLKLDVMEDQHETD